MLWMTALVAPSAFRSGGFIAIDTLPIVLPGRMSETDRIEDAYRFRTASLKNIALTALYGHNGAYPDLYGIIKHHLAPQKSFDDWEPTLANLPKVDWLTKGDFLVCDNAFEMARVRNLSLIHI